MKHVPLLRMAPPLLAAVMVLALALSAVPLVAAEGTTSPLDVVSTLSAQDLAPIAQNLSYTTYKDIAFTGELAATDPEGSAVSFRLIEKAARGAVTLAEDGSGRFTYTPYDNKTGKDSFQYAAVDETGNTSQYATVTVRIEKNKAKMTYADMEGHSAHYAALRLAAENVFLGESLNGQRFFRPDQPVSRSEFVAMAMQVAGMQPLSGVLRTGFYDDAAIAVWAKPFVAGALKAGVVHGSRNDSGQVVFQGNAPVSYAEAGVILNRLLGITDTANVPVTVMAEGESAPVWAYQAVANLQSVQVMEPTSVGLNAALTRSEAAQLLSKTMTLEKR
jgi:hypothetical protein